MKKQTKIVIIIISTIILLGVITFLVFKFHNKKDNASTEQLTTAPAQTTEFKSVDEAIEIVKKLDADGNDNYEYRYKEDDENWWIIEKIEKETNNVILQYSVGKTNGIINTNTVRR